MVTGRGDPSGPKMAAFWRENQAFPKDIALRRAQSAARCAMRRAAVAAPSRRHQSRTLEDRMRSVRWARGLALLPLIALGAAAAQADGGNPLADHVRAANDRFKDVSAAVAEGYAPIPCASGVDGGAMGIHYVSKRQLKDDAIDLAHPEAVMYEPMPDGKLALIAVEYITFKGPASLEGHLFSFTNQPNRYGLAPFY